jgi:hypothetical protein
MEIMAGAFSLAQVLSMMNVPFSLPPFSLPMLSSYYEALR